MKQTSEKKTRQKMPKQLRYSRFFLRKMIPCLLVGGIVAGVRTNRFYQKFDDYDTDCDTWDLRYHINITPDDWGCVQAEDRMNGRGIPDMLRHLSTMKDFSTDAPASEQDIAVMLIRPDTGEYYISEPAVTLSAHMVYDNSIDKKYLATPEEAERFAEAYRDHYDAHYLRYRFLELLDCSALAEHCFTLHKWIENRIAYGVPLHAYVRDSEFTDMTVGFRTGYKVLTGEITEVLPGGTDPGGDWRLVENLRYAEENGSDSDTETLDGFTISGHPTDGPSGELMREVAAYLDKWLPDRLREYNEIKAVLDDKSGAKRYEYYREAYDKAIEDVRTDEQLAAEGYENDDPHTLDKINVPTPEKQLEILIHDIGLMPEKAAMNSKSAFGRYGSKDQPNLRCYTDTKRVTLNGDTYYLFAALSADIGKAMKPYALAYAVQSAIAAILAALLFALPDCLSARRKYKKSMKQNHDQT
ncbi:MAG: hypothetical protein IKX57_06745 [Oscillospiraceae bacterium]|nr:hypothetical protein [Oscillospiraceae bacterium]